MDAASTAANATAEAAHAAPTEREVEEEPREATTTKDEADHAGSSFVEQRGDDFAKNTQEHKDSEDSCSDSQVNIPSILFSPF